MLGKHSEEFWKGYYRALQKHDFNLYQRCINAGEGISLTHNLGHKAAADVEVNIVMMVCDALNLKPTEGR